MSVVHTVDEDNNAGAISLSMDSKVKDCSADGAEICSHREFIDTLMDSNPDDEIVIGLANSENVEAYLKGIEEYIA
jgi:hypothetical protein